MSCKAVNCFNCFNAAGCAAELHPRLIQRT
jgi:hypothetical protein